MLLLACSSPVAGHDGHDHGALPPPVSTTIAPRTDASSAEFEVVVVARGEKLTLYLDTFGGNVPVSGAEIEVDTPQGTQKAVVEGEGIHALAAPWASTPGTYDLAITVSAGGSVDVLTATLTIPPAAAKSPVPAPGRAEAMPQVMPWLAGGAAFIAGLLVAGLFRRRGAALGLMVAGVLAGEIFAGMIPPAGAAEIDSRDVAQRFADGALFVPKGTQRILALRTEFTEVKTYPGTVELPGRIIPDPNGIGYVQASVAGRLMPPPGGFPRLGTPVKAGDVLAHVHPGVGAADVTSQQQQARELDQQITLVARRLDRLRQLQNVVARTQIEDAELELAGLAARRANLDRAPRHTEDLVAPVAGVIAAVQATAGQIAEPNAIIFQIVDPARFWVEALSYEARAIAGAATARLADNRTIALAYRGMGLAERNQAIPIQFGIQDDTRGLRAGQFLTVLATTIEEKTGVAVPRAAILRGSNGQSLVFEHTNAERFVPREVRTEPLDAGRVLIISGLGASRRIVTQGAELLNQIR